MRKPTSVFLLGIAFLLAGCASASGSAGGASRATPNKASSSIITEKQLDKYRNASAYDIVERLHGQWLVNRIPPDMPGAAATPIQVFLGKTRLGGVDETGNYTGGIDELRNYTGGQLSSIEYLTPVQATKRFGQGYPNGVIVLTPR